MDLSTRGDRWDIRRYREHVNLQFPILGSRIVWTVAQECSSGVNNNRFGIAPEYFHPLVGARLWFSVTTEYGS